MKPSIISKCWLYKHIHKFFYWWHNRQEFKNGTLIRGGSFMEMLKKEVKADKRETAIKRKVIEDLKRE